MSASTSSSATIVTAPKAPPTQTHRAPMLIPVAVTIGLSAFLLFLIQPLIAKQILPWFGGSSMVWTSCMLFFQALLLLGYGYADWSTRKLSPKQQATLHLVLLAVSLIWLPPLSSKFSAPALGGEPLLQILTLLFLTIGLPYAVLSSTSPLLQRWLAGLLGQQVDQKQVYRLFALSNLGSLVGLLVYPFAIEPFLAVKTQAWSWALLYLAFVVSCAVVALKVRKQSDVQTSAQADVSAGEPDVVSDQLAPGWAQRMRWILLAALPSVLLLTNTSHLTQNIASVPFLWILPLVLYLLSFVLVFEGRGGQGWYNRNTWLPLVAISLVLMAWGLTKSSGVLPIELGLPIYLGGLFAVCMFCHGELAHDKPAPQYLTRFYLSLSVGGVLGGIIVGIVAPLVFNNYWELPLGLIAIALALVYAHRDSRWILGGFISAGIIAVVLMGVWVFDGTTFDQLREKLVLHEVNYAVHATLLCIAVLMLLALRVQAAVGVALACLVLTTAWGWKYVSNQYLSAVAMSRNFYGVVRVRDISRGDIPVRSMSHGSILHGEQVRDPERALTPTTYYGRGTGLGKAIESFQAQGPTKICMIGLGVGTVGAYGRAQDQIRIYEIDPQVIENSKSLFTFVTANPAKTTIALGDARLVLEKEIKTGQAPGCDVLAVDAFSGDSIPIHLLTTQAFDIYKQALSKRGVIAVHISNRYVDLQPVLLRQIQKTGWIAARHYMLSDGLDFASTWVVMAPRAAELQAMGGNDGSLDDNPRVELWTDDFNNLILSLRIFSPK